MAFKTINVSTTGSAPAQQVMVSWDGLVGVCEGEEYAAVKQIAINPDEALINARQRDLALAWRARVSGVNAILAHDSDPAAIAQQIVAALPANLAEQLLDELAAAITARKA